MLRETTAEGAILVNVICSEDEHLNTPRVRISGLYGALIGAEIYIRVSKLRRVPALLVPYVAAQARPVKTVINLAEAFGFGIGLGHKIYSVASNHAMGISGPCIVPAKKSPPVTRPEGACDRLRLSLSKPALRRAGPALPKALQLGLRIRKTAV